MRKCVAAVWLLALLWARPSWCDRVEPVRLPDGSVVPGVEYDRHVAKSPCVIPGTLQAALVLIRQPSPSFHYVARTFTIGSLHASPGDTT